MACFENFDRYPLIRSYRMHTYGAIRLGLDVMWKRAGTSGFESAVEQRMPPYTSRLALQAAAASWGLILNVER